MFPVRYELNSYISLRQNSVFKGLKKLIEAKMVTKFTTFYKTKRLIIMSNHLLGYNDVHQTFWRNVLASESELGLLFDPEDGGSTFLRNVGLRCKV
jgi:hypothetical protein